jgi:adenine phosphoribosyltransferase
MDLTQFIRAVRDFPAPGILFRDITPLLKEPRALAYVVARLGEAATAAGAEAIVGIESRGFIVGAPIAARMELPFVPVRKPGKLPAPRMSVEYSLEYGESQLDIRDDAFTPGQRAFIVDDLLATGGTARAAAKLVELAGGEVCGMGFVIELAALHGREAVAEYPVTALVRYD